MFKRGYARVEIRPADSRRASDEFIKEAERQIVWELGVREGEHLRHCGVRIFRDELEILRDGDEAFQRTFTFINRGEKVLALAVEKALKTKDIVESVSTINVYLGLDDGVDRSNYGA